MNPFEKVFNYQVMSRLGESGTFTVTAHERAWLKMMLESPSAGKAFMPATLDKLRGMLQADDTLDIGDGFMEKAKSREKQIYHPLIRSIRRIIAGRSGIRMVVRQKNGRLSGGKHGFPYKLEYSMVKKEWYLLWYHPRHTMLMSTRLETIVSLAEEPLAPGEADRNLLRIGQMLEEKKQTAVIEIVNLYNKELSRILYAFSCFDKQVEYDAEANRYHIHVTYIGNESEYILSKIRFLGKRVRVLQGEQLKRRMLESATKALSRYGVEAGDTEESV